MSNETMEAIEQGLILRNEIDDITLDEVEQLEQELYQDNK